MSDYKLELTEEEVVVVLAALKLHGSRPPERAAMEINDQTQTTTQTATAQNNAVSLILDLAVQADLNPAVGYDLAPQLEAWANTVRNLDLEAFVDQYKEYVLAYSSDAPDAVCLHLLTTNQ